MATIQFYEANKDGWGDATLLRANSESSLPCRTDLLVAAQFALCEQWSPPDTALRNESDGQSRLNQANLRQTTVVLAIVLASEVVIAFAAVKSGVAFKMCDVRSSKSLASIWPSMPGVKRSDVT